MVVAVTAACVVQMSRHDVVRVVAMRNRLVSAAWPMRVLAVMGAARVARRARRRVRRVDRERVLVDVVAVDMVQVAVVQEVLMTIVRDAFVTAARAMRMSVIGVCGVAHDERPFFLGLP